MSSIRSSVWRHHSGTASAKAAGDTGLRSSTGAMTSVLDRDYLDSDDPTISDISLSKCSCLPSATYPFDPGVGQLPPPGMGGPSPSPGIGQLPSPGSGRLPPPGLPIWFPPPVPAVTVMLWSLMVTV